MPSTTYICQVLTPMFLNGADTRKPELRAPSLKGAMRFWWRALNGHLLLSELKAEEAEIFGDIRGDQGRRSSLSLRMRPLGELELRDYPLLPHRVGQTGKSPSPAKAIAPGQKFEVVVGTSRPRQLPLAKAEAIFELVALLGGLGKRVRRGMGAFELLTKDGQPLPGPADLAGVHERMLRVGRHFHLGPARITNSHTGRMEHFGWVMGVQLGKPLEKAEDLPRRVGGVASRLLARHGDLSYGASMGMASRGKRFASPVCVSLARVGGELRPILTSLNTFPGYTEGRIDLRIQDEFRREF